MKTHVYNKTSRIWGSTCAPKPRFADTQSGASFFTEGFVGRLAECHGFACAGSFPRPKRNRNTKAAGIDTSACGWSVVRSTLMAILENVPCWSTNQRVSGQRVSAGSYVTAYAPVGMRYTRKSTCLRDQERKGRRQPANVKVNVRQTERRPERCFTDLLRKSETPPAIRPIS